MTEVSVTKSVRRRAKAQVLAWSVADLVVDMVIPTVVYLVLHPLGVAPFLALAAGGLLVGGKAQLGGLGEASGRGAYLAAGGQVVAGLALMFGSSAAGLPAPYAMTLGALPQVAGVSVTLARRRHVDGFALLVFLEVAAGIAVGLVSGDPRFVLARSSVYVALAGVYALVTCFGRRPFMITVSKPMAVAGDPEIEVAFERAAAGSARFRRIETIMTAGLGVLLLAEAVLRVAVVYAYPASQAGKAAAASQIPAIVLLVLAVLAMRFLAVPRLRAIVEAERRALRTEGEAAA